MAIVIKESIPASLLEGSEWRIKETLLSNKLLHLEKDCQIKLQFGTRVWIGQKSFIIVQYFDQGIGNGIDLVGHIELPAGAVVRENIYTYHLQNPVPAVPQMEENRSYVDITIKLCIGTKLLDEKKRKKKKVLVKEIEAKITLHFL